MDCPFDCEFLQKARELDHRVPPDPAQFPNRDIRITEKFLQDNQELLAFLGNTIQRTALDTAGTVDLDGREALDALVRTYRTLQSGLYYEDIPQKPQAAYLFRAVQSALSEYREAETKRLGMSKTRDADVLGLLVFFQRAELYRSNGRPRGRAFLESLHGLYAGGPAASPPSSLILP